MNKHEKFRKEVVRFIEYVNKLFPHIVGVSFEVNRQLIVKASVESCYGTEECFRFEGVDVIPLSFLPHLTDYTVAIMQDVRRVNKKGGAFRAFEGDLMGDARLPVWVN